jgi:hypothetical protein
MPAVPPAAYSALPAPVRTCLRAAGPALRSVAKKDPAGFVKNLLRLLSSSSAALGCRAEEALFLTGFDGSNGTPGRLDAALAELRAVLFLKSEGFTGIGALPRTAGKTADLRAERAGEKYLFEVRWVRDGFGAETAEKLSAKCLKKAAQLRAALKKSGAGSGGVIFVAEPLGSGPLRPSRALAAAAASVRLPARGGPKISVCLVSGNEAAVSPPWSGQ